MSKYYEISANDLFNMIATQPLFLVDVRKENALSEGVITGAVNIPLEMLPVQYEPLTQVENIVFYCYSGIRSAYAAAYAVSKGCINVYTLKGGVQAWQKAGYNFTQIQHN